MYYLIFQLLALSVYFHPLIAREHNTRQFNPGEMQRPGPAPTAYTCKIINGIKQCGDGGNFPIRDLVPR